MRKIHWVKVFGLVPLCCLTVESKTTTTIDRSTSTVKRRLRVSIFSESLEYGENGRFSREGSGMSVRLARRELHGQR